MKVYISGPITGVEGYMQQFDEAERKLSAEENIVINPARVNAALPGETTHEQYMKMSYTMMDMCDIVFFLPGWQQSKGCNLEMQYAIEHGMTITFGESRKCQRNEEKANKPMQESLIKRLGKRFTQETKGNASFAQLDTGWRNQHGMAENSSPLCITYQELPTDSEFQRMELLGANIIMK